LSSNQHAHHAMQASQHAHHAMQASAIPSTDAWDTRDHFVQFYEHEQTLIG